MLNDENNNGQAGDIKGSLAIVILLALAVVTVVLRMHTATEPLTMDTAVYGYISHALLSGEKLYTGVWDHKPPGIFMLFMVSEFFFGYTLKAMAYTGVIFTLASLLFLYLFLKETAGRYAAVIGAALWTLASNSVLLQGNENNAEVFLNTFTLAALWAFVRSRKSTSKKYLVLCGASFAIASLFKTIAVFPLIAVTVYAVLSPCSEEGEVDGARPREKNRVRTLVSLFLPGAILWTAVFLYFAVQGRFPEFWESVFVFNANYSGSIFSNVWTFITSPVLVFHEAYLDVWFLVISALAWIFVSKKEYGPGQSGRLTRGFFILLFIGVLVEVASPGKYFNHYYQLMIPIFCILGALFFVDLRERITVNGNLSGKAVFVLLILLTFLNLAWYQARYLSMTPDEVSRVKHGSGAIDIREMAGFVEARTSPCETIYVWGGEAGIYYYSGRRAASGIFFIFPLFFETEEGRADKLKRIYADLSNAPPALFIRSKAYGTFGADQLFDFVERRYRVVKSFKDVDIYELRERAVKQECGGD